MSAPNPRVTASAARASISQTSVPIAGLVVDIYGLAELPETTRTASCLWLHHARLRSKGDMAGIARQALAGWHAGAAASSSSSAPRGLIAVAFDQRNHGTRLVTDSANRAWHGGNGTHAQDMFGIVSGAVVDTGLLIDALEGYILGAGDRVIDQHLALGVSLGGHSVWQLMFAEPRVSVGVMVIGCPDYMALMANRARLSKLSSFSVADDGASFLGSRHFPPALVKACKKYDPKGILFGTGPVSCPTPDQEKERLRPILDSRIRGKRFQILSGGADKLVPYGQGAPFLDFLKSAAHTWYKTGGVSVEDHVYPEAGHVFNTDMMRDAVRFILDSVKEADKVSETTPKI